MPGERLDVALRTPVDKEARSLHGYALPIAIGSNLTGYTRLVTGLIKTVPRLLVGMVTLSQWLSLGHSFHCGTVVQETHLFTELGYSLIMDKQI